MNNQIARQKPSFSTAITTDKFQRAINNTLQDPAPSKTLYIIYHFGGVCQSCTTRV